MGERAGARRLLAAIRALVRRFSVSERADVSCCGTTVAQAATLEALLADGPMRAGELCNRLGISPSTLTRNLARLERKGHVRRDGDETDRRALRIVLTKVGRRAAEELEGIEEDFAASVLARVPSSRRHQVVEGLEALLAAVRDATEGCCPGAFEHLMTESPTRRSTEGRRKP